MFTKHQRSLSVGSRPTLDLFLHLSPVKNKPAATKIDLKQEGMNTQLKYT